MVSHRKAAALVAGHHRPFERSYDLRCVGIGDRKRRDLEEGSGFLAGQPPGVRRRSDARSQWIARIKGHVLDRAALDSALRTSTALGIGIVARESVVGGIGIDEGPDRAM